MIRSALLLSTVIGATAALAASSFAATHHPPRHATNSVPSFVQRHVATGNSSGNRLRKSVVASGAFDSTAPSGPTVLDTQTVTCGSPAGTCTFELSAMVQNCGFSTAGSDYAIQATVDGVFVDGGPFLGSTQAESVCDAGNWQGFISVPVGTHTVQYLGYVSVPTFIAAWSVRTDIAKP